MSNPYPRAFIVAPNKHETPGRVKNEPVGVLMVWGDGRWDYEFQTIEDQARVLGFLEPMNMANPEIGDYIRERLDQPWRIAFWEVEVRPGDTTLTILQRIMTIKKGLTDGG